MKLGIPTVATSTWTSQQVRRWILPSDDSVQWSDGLGLMHLVERVLPDALAGRELSSFNLSNDVRIAGLIRGGKARVDVTGLFAQEDDIVQFLVTNEGLASLHEFLKAGQA
jgi:trk system potassium uptake protein TrkA